MLADRLRMVQVQSLPDFINGYPYLYTNTTNQNPYYPIPQTKIIRTTTTALIQIYLQSGNGWNGLGKSFYFENATGSSVNIRILAGYTYNYTIPANQRWLFITQGNSTTISNISTMSQPIS